MDQSLVIRQSIRLGYYSQVIALATVQPVVEMRNCDYAPTVGMMIGIALAIEAVPPVWAGMRDGTRSIADSAADSAACGWDRNA
jgi:hypothetical protein